MRNTRLGLFLAIGLLGCGSSQTTSQPTASAPPPAAQHAGEGGCPMMQGMEGASIAATDTGDGAAIAFTTTRDAAALRARIHHMADMHNGMMAHGEGTHGGMGSGEMHGGMGKGMHGGAEMHMVPSRASVEDIPSGARLVLVPNDPAQLSTLRAHVHEHAAMMAKGECPMKEMQHDEHAHPPGS